MPGNRDSEWRERTAERNPSDGEKYREKESVSGASGGGSGAEPGTLSMFATASRPCYRVGLYATMISRIARARRTYENKFLSNIKSHDSHAGLKMFTTVC